MGCGFKTCEELKGRASDEGARHEVNGEAFCLADPLQARYQLVLRRSRRPLLNRFRGQKMQNPLYRDDTRVELMPLVMSLCLVVGSFLSRLASRDVPQVMSKAYTVGPLRGAFEGPPTLFLNNSHLLKDLNVTFQPWKSISVGLQAL